MKIEDIEGLAAELKRVADDISRWIEDEPNRGERRQMQSLVRQLRMSEVDLSSMKYKIVKMSSYDVADVRDMSIERLSVGKRVKRVLRHILWNEEDAAAHTVGFLVDNVSSQDLTREHGFGRKSLADLNECLRRLSAEYGVTLEIKEGVYE